LISTPSGFFRILVCLLTLLLISSCNDTAEMSFPASPTPLPSATATPTRIPASPTPPAGRFDGERALATVADQLAFGPRWPGSAGHISVGDYIVDELRAAGWSVEEQHFEYQSFPGRNLIARGNQGKGDLVVLGAHYDTRKIADQTPGAAEAGLPVPGAVDGASGVAVLLELARALDLERVPGELWLVFFDLEDNGNGGIPGWPYAAGSPFVAESIATPPAAIVIVDMVGDKDQQLFIERNSDWGLSQELWSTAAGLGYRDSFIPELGYSMLDDHLPFIRRGFRVALIIDFDYPYWHTVDDTLDKVSADSLFRVGNTLKVWLES
jgi:hypothetical protein